MPSCIHPVAYLNTQLRKNPQTLTPEYHLICDACGKDIPIELNQAFIWIKLLELRDAMAELVVQSRAHDPMGGS
jgi:hypothetical protein